MLDALGMPNVKNGDFPYIGGETMGVAKMTHNVVLQVDENGTKAAALSAAGMLGSAYVPVTFDHPFIFAIRENTTGAILFMGKVVKL